MKRSKEKKIIDKKILAKQNGQKKPTVKKTDIRKKENQSNTFESNISFPVVGIGSSAGGLEAFSKFLSHLQPDLGMAYVYVQHISATHESL